MALRFRKSKYCKKIGGTTAVSHARSYAQTSKRSELPVHLAAQPHNSAELCKGHDYIKTDPILTLTNQSEDKQAKPIRQPLRHNREQEA